VRFFVSKNKNGENMGFEIKIGCEQLSTPKMLEENGFLSLTRQWQMRRDGKLKYLKIGRKIYYRASDLDALFKASEMTAEVEN